MVCKLQLEGRELLSPEAAGASFLEPLLPEYCIGIKQILQTPPYCSVKFSIFANAKIIWSSKTKCKAGPACSKNSTLKCSVGMRGIDGV